MTPISRFFERFIPAWLVWPAVTATYLAMILAIAIFDPIGGESIIYIDMRE